ncbi:hypothetical protein OpiT1DRAFT_00515 [Opitutaceae bacterium TAV1]|nr:hypothetical protein OpiT1DRAFT_00515 [Opitutaceae bacterium TAV1]
MKTTFPSTSIRSHTTFALLLAALLPAVSARAAFVPVHDDFSTLDPARWTTAASSTTSGILPSVADGFLSAGSGATGGSQRSVLISKSDNVNPFSEKSLTLLFSGLAISGTPGTGGNAFYAMVGNYSSAADGTGHLWYPGQTASDGTGYIALLINKTATSTQLIVRERLSGSSSNDLFTQTLTGVPESVSWTLDGSGATATWSVTLSGSGLDSPLTWSGSSALASSHLASGSRLALGAFNNGAVTAATTIRLDALDVTAIPEPSHAVTLIGAGALITAGACLRRRARR